MIGVIPKDSEVGVVEEFFQLFKTPWEFYKENREYDVVLMSRDSATDKIIAKVLIIFGSETKKFDSDNGISLEMNRIIKILRFDNISFPIYSNLSSFRKISEENIVLEVDSDVFGLKIQKSKQIILRIGYNLFEEIRYLLSEGQPVDYAFIPTLDIHISILKKWITELGIPLIEIPPIPAGFNFITCLTHDVDFVKICDHLFDHSMWGFVHRGIFGSVKYFIEGKISFSRVIKNWRAVFSLPFVYLRLLNDFWFQFDHYLEIEKDLTSTFFFIPFKYRVGDNVSAQNASLRRAKYDITKLKELLVHLINNGNEIGLHGIDAWHNAINGFQERKLIAEIISRPNLGVRIHWLLQNCQTFQALEKAGFLYDSTSGYNETIGYRCGTAQVFLPSGLKKLFELPLHIQDTALFYPNRMNLSEKEALYLCKKLIKNASIYAGVLTINWHQRSLAPERLWGDFYIKLLKELRSERPWFATASQIVEWFRKRRAVFFDKVQFLGNKFRFILRTDEPDIHPSLLLRVHLPFIQRIQSGDISNQYQNYFDIEWKGEKKIEISI